MTVVALVLAAGCSARFGSDKRRAALAEGTSVLGQSVEHALAVFDEVRVVLRDGECAQDLGLPQGCSVVHSYDAALGMGHSLAAGVASLGDSSAQAVAVVLGDMPWISCATLRRLAEAASASNIVLPQHAGRQGHPVVFGRVFWPALMKLVGDEGARRVVRANPAHCVAVAVDDEGVLRDVDTPNAL
ncbi:nucleotidyltransferase family protein [Pseudomonas guariconensis]|uniref:nucleotidyltransferase family protein n=1 Tax=Pseudomonas guariconensis TaxID=1288410 RepID=UPI0018AB732F|nr:nucleotidyltransferase family protein [Pseudomonas guariconensis]MBF8739787.1 nucleotidyltransferase family protein [Pseudomonas guariconensis]MBF8749069.1 nucleotidyltransferase family protein [Pseudomonas guariconensis]